MGSLRINMNHYNELTDLTHTLLLAMPCQEGEVFAKMALYVSEHNEHGLLGLIINQPTQWALKDIFSKIDIHLSKQHPSSEQIVLAGGNQHTDKGFVLHKTSTLEKFSSQIRRVFSLSTSIDVLQSIALEQKPWPFLMCMGCMVWNTEEIARNMQAQKWLICPVTAIQESIIFAQNHEQTYHDVLASMGLAYWQLKGSGQAQKLS